MSANAFIFSFLISNFINSSFETGKFPEILKCARVIPTFKKGNSKEVCNYRPIANLSILSKIYEKIVLDKLLYYVNSNNLLHHNQYGFTKDKNTETAFLHLINLVTAAINKHKVVSITFLDYSKAFDTISHDILCTKLRLEYYLSNKAVTWLWSFLTNRSQYVYSNSSNSNVLFLNYGVPQGSILGPTLFNLYINDIHQAIINIDSTLLLYADDTVLITQSSNYSTLETKTNEELASISNWCKKNKLILNHSKTKTMLINTQVEHFNIKTNDYTIEKVSSYSYLGYIIDDKLKFKSQIDSITGKIKSCNYILARTAPFLPKHSLITIYNSIALSHIIYNKFIILISSKNECKHIQSKLNTSNMIINHSFNINNNINPEKFNLEYITKYYSYILLFKVIKSNFATPLFKISTTMNTTTTRQINNIKSAYARNKLCSKGFYHFAPIFWNSLPNDIKNCENISKYKQKIKI